MKKRVLAVLCMAIMTMCQFAFLLPEEVSAATPKPGTDLVIRVGYLGDYHDYRTKATLSAGQLANLPQQTKRYTNLTNRGTIKSFIAIGPTVTAVLQEAGIDIGSVSHIDLRTKDGKGTEGRFEEDLTNPTYLVSAYLQSTRYYYPNLEANWKNMDKSGIPLEGALKGKETVPTILALKSSDDEAKKPENGAQGLTPSMMNKKNSYRFCVGQTPITEGVQTSWPRDVTSSKTAKWIYGIDVTLKGTPVTGIKVDLGADKLVVGSKMQAKVKTTGNELFEKNLKGKNITWSTSNPKVATVSDTGVIAFKSKGYVEIKATDKDTGLSTVLPLNVVGEGEEEKAAAVAAKKGKSKKESQNTEAALKTASKEDNKKDNKVEKKDPKSLKKVAAGMQVKQVSLGDEIGMTQYDRPEINKKVTPLPKQEADPGALLIAGVTAVIFFLGGIVLRIDRYFREV